MTLFEDDPYIWFDPFELYEDFQYHLESEERLHREAMNRMAEAHHIAGQRFHAHMLDLERRLAVAPLPSLLTAEQAARLTPAPR